MSKPLSLSEIAIANLQWEEARQKECEARVHGRCALVDAAIGAAVTSVGKENCDECFALGGINGGESVRNRIVELTLEGIRKNPHLLRDEDRKLLERTRLETLTVSPGATSPKQRWDKVRGTWEMASSFVKAMKSRGPGALVGGGKRVELTIKERRYISCFGKKLDGTLVASGPCEALRLAADGIHHFCDDCGCGDRTLAYLDGDDGDYTKLDYPYLECPRRRDGFSNALGSSSDSEKESVVLSAVGHGLGDLMVTLWLAEGMRVSNRLVRFYVPREERERREVLERFSFGLTDDPSGAIAFGQGSTARRHELEVVGDSASRATAWASTLPGNPVPMRPTLSLTDGDKASGKAIVEEFGAQFPGRPTVMLFPTAAWAPRMWPLAYWMDLAWLLHAAKVNVAGFFSAKDKHDYPTLTALPRYYYGIGWPVLMASMQVASLVIGNDSGPVHVAGTVGAEALAVCGPQLRCFEHYPTVEVFSIRREEMGCVGCGFRGERGYRAACDFQCRAMMELGPEKVFERVLAKLRVGRGE
jgi:hypothetical protein